MLPARYVGWGLLFGFLIPLADVLFEWRGKQFQPWDSPSHIGFNVGQFLGAMLALGIVTMIVGFVSRRALRNRLGGSHLEAGDRRAVQPSV